MMKSRVICPRINILDLEQAFLKIYEEKYHLELKEVQRTLGTTILNPGESNNYFETEMPIAVFILDGAVFTVDDKIVEIEKSFYRGDKYKFSIAAKPQLFNEKKQANSQMDKNTKRIFLNSQVHFFKLYDKCWQKEKSSL